MTAATTDRYPTEILDDEDDDGTMPANVEEFRDAVVGHRIVSVEPDVEVLDRWGYTETATVITLDNGKRVTLVEGGDCCAYTNVEGFFLNPELVDHAITGVGTTDGYTTWHVFADAGDIMSLDVGWSCGNPFYYGYGFTITVQDVPAEDAAVVLSPAPDATLVELDRVATAVLLPGDRA